MEYYSYQVGGGGKLNHHMPGFNRRSDWDEYFDQVFNCPYQDQLSRGIEFLKVTHRRPIIEPPRR